MDTLIGTNQWDQQPGETVKAFEAFRTYRDMGPTRTIMKALKLNTGKENTRGRYDVWSMQNDWVNRCNAYDRFMDQQYTNGVAKQVKDMAERHAAMASVFLNKVVQRLQTIDPNSLTPDQLLKWFDVCTKVERLSRGESTENVRQHHSGEVVNKLDLSGISDDEFDAIHAIIIRATNPRTVVGRVVKEKERELITVR